MQKKKIPSNASMYIEISVLVLFFVIMLAPIFAVIHNHNSESQSDATKESSSQEKNTPNTTINTEHNVTPTEPTQTTTPTEPTPSQTTPAQPEPTQDLTPVEPQKPSKPTTPSCYHEEYGICWDELEDNNYSAGLYDYEYGHYGASVIYPESCDAFCRDIVEDAYDEGWYDASY